MLLIDDIHDFIVISANRCRFTSPTQKSASLTYWRGFDIMIKMNFSAYEIYYGTNPLWYKTTMVCGKETGCKGNYGTEILFCFCRVARSVLSAT